MIACPFDERGRRREGNTSPDAYIQSLSHTERLVKDYTAKRFGKKSFDPMYAYVEFSVVISDNWEVIYLFRRSIPYSD
ncbi:hypothetical protein NPIL_695121 [Nephila pilipes]|uniref:Uncharacterized protein n=1 Tax=Nephila pilipes TaxID=299642 RepID=A0A8X6NJ20_NEPPI|nr:hypothetical protein NPIL_695121 [Nephila pilipes]